MRIYSKIYILIILLILIVIGGCGTSRHSHFSAHQRSRPVGVDSLTIAEADSLIPHLFVSYQATRNAAHLAEEANSVYFLADSLWQILTAESEELKSNNEALLPEHAQRKRKSAQSSFDEVRKMLAIAEKKFLKSIKMDPFPLDSRDGLVQTYFLMAEIENKKEYYQKAEHQLRQLVNYEKGEHFVFFNLAECYFQLEEWNDAFNNYRRATDVFLETQTFSTKHTIASNELDSLDNVLLFTYLYSQAVSLSKMYRAEEAIALTKQAKKVAVTEEHKAIAARFEKWLNWDNGNIQTAERRDEILKLVEAAKYQEAAEQFQALQKSLSDSRAINEIEWRIAGLEFQYLNKKEQACERLFRVVKQQENSPMNFTLRDEREQQYLKDCGAMHYHLGMSYIDKANYRLAKKYLDVGAEIDWYGSYKCQLELAKMNKHNPQLSLNLIEKVLNASSNLTIVEQLDALQVKLKVLKKLGPQYLAEAKQTYLQIRELQKY